jgi:hypothetical protein
LGILHAETGFPLSVKVSRSLNETARPPLIYSDRPAAAVYCPGCGTVASEGSPYCRNCGALLPISSPAAAAQPPAPLQVSTRVSEQDRSPLMAAILNLLFGLGYVYLGYNKVTGVHVAVFVALMIAVYFIAGIATDGLLSLIIAVVLAVDGYQKAMGLRGYISAA